MTRVSEISRRFYLKNSVTPFEEDSTHEFKGHRNISAEEVPPWCYIPGTDRRSRKAVSRWLYIQVYPQKYLHRCHNSTLISIF